MQSQDSAKIGIDDYFILKVKKLNVTKSKMALLKFRWS